MLPAIAAVLSGAAAVIFTIRSSGVRPSASLLAALGGSGRSRWPPWRPPSRCRPGIRRSRRPRSGAPALQRPGPGGAGTSRRTVARRRTGPRSQAPQPAAPAATPSTCSPRR
ncbi:hypothetical protein NKH18_44990 [Streptomyces sp. M10(2022)]